MKADFVLDYNLFAVERAEHVYLLARIQADAPPAAGDRHPLNLSLVLDRSGSMQGAKLEYVQQAAQFLVQRLGADDYLSVVSYNEAVLVDVPAQAVIQKDRINAVIQKLFASGMTNLSGGWLQGCQLVADNMAEGQVNRVLLLTDGLANRGVTDAVKLEAIARQKRAEGVTTTTMGVGLEFNEDLLTRIAKEGGGAYYFIDNPDQAPAIFEEELKGLLNVVGQNLTVILTPAQNVEMVRQLNAYQTEKNGAAVVFRLGDLFADELKTLLLELTIPALKDLGQVEVAQLRFEYDELGESSVTHRVIDLPVWVNVVSADQIEGRQRDQEVVKTALLLEAARAREEAVEHADKGEFDRASEVLSQTAARMREFDDDEVQKQHDMLREEAVDMELGPQRYTAYERKSSTTKSFYTSTVPLDATQSISLHNRLKSTRQAVERKGETPVRIVWRSGSLTLTDKVEIGRADDNDIVIADPAVSSYHCVIVQQDGDYFLHDLHSTNGTYANGGRVEGHFRLSVGDVMTVGSLLFILEGDAQE
jgi:Ca-activated chloride channel family protein